MQQEQQKGFVLTSPCIKGFSALPCNAGKTGSMDLAPL